MPEKILVDGPLSYEKAVGSFWGDFFDEVFKRAAFLQVDSKHLG